MANLSDLIISHREITSYFELEQLVEEEDLGRIGQVGEEGLVEGPWNGELASS